MLGVSNYTQDYVDDCRTRVDEQLAAYRALRDRARDGDGTEAAVDAFEPRFFNTMILALEGSFVHRLRTKELKDGNPLNEVRVLATSIMSNGGVLAADKQIKLKPDSSVLGLDVGDPIALDAYDFTRLSDAFFAEIQRKYI
jgi:hypothetical protein